MTSADMLRLGYIPYLNAVPFYHFLKQNGFAGQLISGVPAELNRLLQLGELHVSPSSSFEYARHWRDYLLLPKHAISSSGKVKSVLLFSPGELEDLNGEEIAITGESATSINLLRVILREFVALKQVVDKVPSEPVEARISVGQPALLIGDRALQMAEKLPVGMRCYDLGEIWYQQTGLPFVFALWMVRRDASDVFSFQLAQLSTQLHSSLQQVFASPEMVAADFAGRSELSTQQIAAYWQGIDYDLTEAHLAGMRLFFQLCVKQQLLEDEPVLEFLPG
jgi:chorismate dehydratase